jgi:hypothetical protein
MPALGPKIVWRLFIREKKMVSKVEDTNKKDLPKLLDS